MTVSSSTNRASYSGNGSTTVFAYGFKIFDQDDLTVILRAADGTETTQTITTHYTVSGVGSVSGGNVTFVTAPASGVTVVILREQPLTQGLDLVANDPFPSASFEDQLDKLTFMVQQHDEELGRAIKASKTNTLTGSEFTISAADRANKVFSFDSSGDLSVTQELGTFKGDWAASTAYVERDLVRDSSDGSIYIVTSAHTSSGSTPLDTNTNSSKYDAIFDVGAMIAGTVTMTGDLTVQGNTTLGNASSDSITMTGTAANLRMSTTNVTDILDEDTMSSDSATALATQQSIKAYVDSQVGASDTLTEILGNGNTTSGANIQMTTTDELQFRDTALKISSSADGQLDIDADTEIEITAPTVDINASTEVNISADLSVDTDTLHVDSTNDRVGINTTSPDRDLTVIGTGHFGATTAGVYLSNSGTTGVISGMTSGGTYKDLRITSDGLTHYLHFDPDGGIGINQDSPSSFAGAANNLVIGGASGSGGMTIVAGSTGTGAIYFADGTTGDALDAGYIKYNHQYDRLSFGTASALNDTIRVTSAGDVGIGLSGDPSTKLDVNGTVTADGLTVEGTALEATFSGSTSSTIHIKGDTSNSGDANEEDATLRMSTDNGAFHHRISVLNGAGTAPMQFTHFNGTADNKTLTIGYDGDISFFEDTGTTAKFFWDASTENLGIRTASPVTPLHVSGGSATRADIQITTSATGETAGDGFQIGYIDSSGAFNWNYENSDWYVGTNNNRRLTINGSGQVGIGNATPATALDVTGTVTADGLTVETSGDPSPLIRNTSTGTVSLTLRRGANDDAYTDWTFDNTGGNLSIISDDTTRPNATRIKMTYDGDVSFYEDTGTTAKFFWDASAERLGIGTSSPSTKVHLKGDWVSNEGQLAIDANSGQQYSGLTLQNNGTAKFFLYHDNSNNLVNIYGDLSQSLAFYTNGNNERMRIDSSGNVGIGTTSPDVALRIQRSSTDTYSSSSSSAAVPYTSNDPATTIVNASLTNGSAAYLGLLSVNSNGLTNTSYIANISKSGSGQYSGDLVFGSRTGQTAYAERMRIDSNGNVGIGTDSPSSEVRLDVDTGTNSHAARFTNDTAGYACAIFDNQASSGTRNFTSFRINNSAVGTITSTGSTTAYNTSSDHRLKENVVELTGATARLKQLEPKRFNFIADADTTVDGFLAHEVQSVVPEAITGTHNEVDADGNPVYQGIDQSKLVPLLVATIKELEARITALEGE